MQHELLKALTLVLCTAGVTTVLFQPVVGTQEAVEAAKILLRE